MAQASAQRERLDLATFLREVAANAPYAGIEHVQARAASRPARPWPTRSKLEDALTHLLTNAQRYRVPGSPITLTLSATESEARIEVRNQGPTIAPDRLATLFELGTSDASSQTQRGQGLFVARGYLAKMGGSIEVRNRADGVYPLPRSR